MTFDTACSSGLMAVPAGSVDMAGTVGSAGPHLRGRSAVTAPVGSVATADSAAPAALAGPAATAALVSPSAAPAERAVTAVTPAQAVAAVWGVTAATAPPRPTAWTPANTGH
ncbi:Uncharacterised protein [Mycobacterium tuberculosis]|uniref:Uncharacterized protein n=1 Tax=Mycobacterium tuberculosis TaxID=1773 RepID=A0A655AWH5_MYCTX|nr:Uncharacterised protein [Mycobacterium tuberculosis]